MDPAPPAHPGDESQTYPKKSLKLKLDGAPFIDGRTTLNFNTDHLDQSYLHTVVSSRLLRDSGHPAVAAEHARLYLNGDFLGLYVRVENMDEEFLAARGLDPDGNLYKATLDGASLSIYDDIDHHWRRRPTRAAAGRTSATSSRGSTRYRMPIIMTLRGRREHAPRQRQYLLSQLLHVPRR